MRTRSTLGLLFAGTVALASSSAVGDGKPGEGDRLTAELRASEKLLGLEAVADPLQFVAKVGDKYHLVRVFVTNRNETRLTLERSQVRAALQFRSEASSKTIAAVVDLAKQDAPVWDALPDWQRRLLRFPPDLGARESDSIVLFVPATGLSGLASPRLVAISLTLFNGGTATLLPPSVSKK